MGERIATAGSSDRFATLGVDETALHSASFVLGYLGSYSKEVLA